jgi:serine/threonine protein kinase/Tfp pilus assembly protein PilF
VEPADNTPTLPTSSQPTIEPGATFRAAFGEQSGESIGPYKLLEVIGEGGFGTVWLAERREPMVQRVALKIIKPGMDSKAVVTRFEQERQALAVMEHPNVAKVLDGGVTPTGRPYFVMELVKGEPITDFCDRQRLAIKQRLELFIPVCDAVQHAHHKGLIHRDLKPGNVLVAEIEGKPVPKVIDFGVAKAVTSEGWANTAHTQSGMVIGTPEYMSPEQVAGELDVDTRTDVYSLGVLLYELLTGELPFSSQELRRAAMVEIARIIKEVAPPKPSTRLAQLAGERTTTIAQARSATRERITSELRRELDWIPLMALRKERERRYASPRAMADDVRRYLEGRPLHAAPESRAYLARKFVRRNKMQVFAASAVFVALGAGLAIALWQRDEAQAQRSRADERADAATRAEAAATAARDAEKQRADQLKKVSDFQSRMLAQIDTAAAGVELMKDVRERFVAAIEKAGVPESERGTRLDALWQELVRVNATDAAAAMIDRTILRPAVGAIDQQFKDDPATDASLRQALADLYRTIGLYDAAMPLQESALATRRRVLGQEHPDTLTSINNLGGLLQFQGRLDEAEPHYRESLEKRRRVLGEEHPGTLTSINNLGVLLRDQGRLTEAEPYMREGTDKLRRVLGEEHPDTLISIGNLGLVLHGQGKLAEAERYYREALEKRRLVLGEEHPATLLALSNLSVLLRDQGRLAEAESYAREALEKRRRVLGEEHPDTLSSINTMGNLLEAQGKLAEAEPYYREALEKSRRVLGEEHPRTLISVNNLGSLLEAQGKLVEAEPYYREALERSRRVLGEEHPDTLISVNNLGSLLQGQGKLAEAEPYYREAMEKFRRVLGDEHPNTLQIINNLGYLLQLQGKLAEAEPYYREAVDKLRRVLGEEHPVTLVCLSNMAALARRQGNHEQAMDLLVHAEPAARRAFTGGSSRRLASFLTALGRARMEVGFDPERFDLAESNLLEAYAIYVAASDRGPTHEDTLACVQGLVDIYTGWDKADPGKGHDGKAAEWQTRLDAGKAEAEPIEQGTTEKR